MCFLPLIEADFDVIVSAPCTGVQLATWCYYANEEKRTYFGCTSCEAFRIADDRVENHPKVTVAVERGNFKCNGVAWSGPRDTLVRFPGPPLTRQNRFEHTWSSRG